MKLPVAILAVAAVALAACDRPANTAYNNSGQNTGITAPMAPPEYVRDSAASESASGSAADSAGATQSPATSDRASPSVGEARATSDDAVTSQKILSALVAVPGLDNASVKTENGVVTLGGTASSQEQVSLATGIAQKQEGVSRVESEIGLR